MKYLTKGLITIFASTFIVQGLNAKTTMCYKNEWKSPSTIETVKLDGGECNGNFSYKEMMKKGWNLKDITITKGKEGLNYTYLLSDEEEIKVDNSNFMENKVAKLDYRAMATRLKNVTDDSATIAIGNLRVGQSAVIQHNYENGKSLLVANGFVTSSNENSSTLKLTPFLDIKQNALPTSNRKAVEGDIAIINYLYDTSLIIAPSQDAFTATRNKYRDNNFLHSDLFAAKLKDEGEPIPSKKIIQDYAISQNIGTIFFVIKNKVYIVDSKTFAILDSDTISYNFVENEQMPFYTRIEKIEKNIIKKVTEYTEWFSFLDRFIGNDKRTEDEVLLEDYVKSGELEVKAEIYNDYYEKLLGIKK